MVLMEQIEQWASAFSGFVWGIPLVILLFGAGLLFTVYFAFPQFRLSKKAFDIIAGKHDDPNEKGEISHFQALCAALSATIGLGNIAGVAVAISAGGPGAVFWMWVAGFLGMATKFTSISLALTYREECPETGNVYGGTMFTIKNALGKKYYPLAVIYAIFTIFAAFGAGNMFQSNQIASMVESSLGISKYISGGLFALLAGLVLVGGIKRIGNIASKLVPSMLVIYLVGSVGLLIYNYAIIPSVFLQIFTDAFTGTAAVGGFAGVAFKEVVMHGVRRAVFSNEAGLGTASMAHSAAKSHPIQEGIVGMIEPFVDTILVCTLTALVILVTGAWTSSSGVQGVELTSAAFMTLYGSFGKYMLTLVVIMFAFSTIISWSYYGETGVVFLFGGKGINAYRYVFVAVVFLGAVLKLSTVINLADAFYGLIAIPNLLANVFLTKKLKGKLKEYEAGNELA
jgi:AGCS family alanine or glycine:cation symporter